MSEEQLHQKLIEGFGELKAGIQGVHQRLDKLNGAIEKHDDRIRALEQKEAVATSGGYEGRISNLESYRDKSLGIATAVSFVMGLVGSWISRVFKLWLLGGICG